MRQRRFLSNQTNVAATWKTAPETPAVEKRVAAVDPTCVPEYSAEICEYFLASEKSLYRSRNYMENQSEVTDRMRKILVDWLTDVVSEFKQHPETFFLAVDIIDRYLYQRTIPRTKLQLVGITAVLIAAKHEEIWPPTIQDCVVVTANTYTAREVVEMEREVATCLRFRFTVPTVYPLACHFMEAARCSSQVRSAIFLFLESASHCYPLLSYLPSRVAAASTILGRMLISHNSVPQRRDQVLPPISFWGLDMLRVSGGITVDDLALALAVLLPFTHRLCNPNSKLQAVRRKYLSQKCHGVAALDFPPIALIL